jgi:hypothetical protein
MGGFNSLYQPLVLITIMRNIASRPFVFVDNDGSVYSSPNMTYLPAIPAYADVYNDEIQHPREIKKLRWASARSPHLAYVPRSTTFDNPIFERLICSYRNIRIIREGNWYLLSLEIQARWLRLEQALRWVASAILSDNRVNLPLGFNAGPFPSAYGYLQKHRDESHARYSAMKSRDAFLGLMALCSFAISTTKPAPHHKPQRWVTILQRNDANIQASWIEDFAHSAAVDFSESIGRVGMVANVADMERTEFIDCMILANVPIWLYWGNKNNPPNKYPTRLHKYLPLGSELASLQRPLASPNATTADIKLPAGSRQRPDEDWKAYFIRRTAQRTKFFERESNEQRSRREARERKNLSFPTPTRKGAHVFHWEEQGDGVRIRKRIPFRDIYEFWGEYANTQKRYDGITDEWDVCTEFDPEAVGPDILDEHDEIANQLYQPIDDAVPDATVWQEVSPGYRAEANCIQYEEPPQTLDEIARCRYGIQIRDGPYTRLPLPERMDWDKAMRIMGEENRQVQDTRLEDAILDMLQWLINIDRLGASNPPASLWDLHPNNHQYLFGRQDAISTVTVKYTNEDKVYLIQSNFLHSRRNSEWSLVLSNPAAALECLRRRWGPHYSDIALQLLLRGCPFSTRIIGPKPVLSYPRPYVTTLGFRPPGYVPRDCDYASYEALRDKFLQTPRARAALLKGGIVWRLSWDAVGVEAALGGPSPEVFQTGHWFLSEDMYLWDDELSEDELNLICGVYKVFTGKQYQRTRCIDGLCLNMCVR